MSISNQTALPEFTLETGINYSGSVCQLTAGTDFSLRRTSFRCVPLNTFVASYLTVL